jgi:hypothetical protein
MKKGYRLETQVKAAVEELIQSGTLGLTKRYCKVFLNKGYYSKDRNNEIIVDVSIELIPPKTSAPSLLWIWECKDYSRAVPVDDIEEFHAKLEQIAADKTKGTMITTGRYQESTIQYALSKGIGLTRLIDGREVHVESIPGHYMRAFDSAMCAYALKYEKGMLQWNSYTHRLPRSSNEYFFSLTSDDTGIYTASSVEMLEKLFCCEFRQEATWLKFPGTF